MNDNEPREAATSNHTPTKTRKHGGLTVFLIIFLSLGLLAGASYSIYAFMKLDDQSSLIKNKDTQIENLNDTISSQKSPALSSMIVEKLPNGKTATYSDNEGNRNILFSSIGSTPDEVSSRYVFISNKIYGQYMSSLDNDVRVAQCGTDSDLKALQNDLIYGMLNTQDKKITPPQNGNCLQAVASASNPDMTTRASAQKAISEIESNMQGFISSVSIK